MLKLLHLIFAWIMWVCRLYHSSSRFCSSFTTFMDLTASHVLNGRFLPQNSVELHVFTNFNRKDSCTIFFFFLWNRLKVKISIRHMQRGRGNLELCMVILIYQIKLIWGLTDTLIIYFGMCFIIVYLGEFSFLWGFIWTLTRVSILLFS